MTRNAISWNIVKKDVDPGFTVKATLSRKVAKLTRRLAGFAPETLHLQVLLERLPRKGAFTAKFTLRLPSHILHSEKSAENLPAAIDSLIRQRRRWPAKSIHCVPNCAAITAGSGPPGARA